MKNQVLVWGLSLICGSVFSQASGLKVNGRDIYDLCKQQVLLKGVNYPVLDDWDFPASSEKSAEIAQTGANAVRIQWYINYGNQSRPGYALSDLDTVISRVARLDMIPILELHDYTCAGDLSALNTTVTAWYTSQPVLALIDKHKEYLIVNILNEAGEVRWAQNPAQAEQNFKNAYIQAINTLRNAGIHTLLMIDAPDCGSTLSTLVNIGQELLDNDPDTNLVFSTHTYWIAYTGNDSVNIRAELQTAYDSGLPIVLGEVATEQDEVGTPCMYQLNYKAILRIAEDLDFGWLIWSWYKDQCPNRAMTTNGNFNALTAFGQEITHDPAFGLQNVSQLSPYLVTDGACITSVNEQTGAVARIFPNPASDYLQVMFAQPPLAPVPYLVFSAEGRQVQNGMLVAGQPVSLSGLEPGIYFLVCEGSRERFVVLR